MDKLSVQFLEQQLKELLDIINTKTSFSIYRTKDIVQQLEEE